MAIVEVGDYFVKEDGEAYEVIDTIPERSEYICVHYDKNGKFLERDLVLSSLHFYMLNAVHSIMCIEFKLPYEHQKLIIPASELDRFEYSAYLPEYYSVGDVVTLTAVYFPKAKYESLGEFQG